MKSLQRSRRGLGFVEGAGARDSTLAFEESAIGRGHREKILCSSAIDINVFTLHHNFLMLDSLSYGISGGF
jgi:hypothetical protein